MRNNFRNDAIPVLCASCDARHRGVCGALDGTQLTALSRAAHRHVVEEGEGLVADAQRVERYANLLSGVVKLTKTLADGRQQIVALRFAPDFLGRPFRPESALHAQAATSVVLCSFPRAIVERMLGEQPELQRRVLRQTLDELDDAREWMVTLGRKTAIEKVASFLLLIARNVEPDTASADDAVTFDLPLTRADIADFLGLTIETVSRQFTRLRAEGVIEVSNNRSVVIAQIARLKARCGD